MRSRLSVALALAAATCCALPRAASAARPVHVRGGGGNSRARDAARGTYTNPVIPGVNTPDPGVVWDAASNLWYAVATSGDRQNAFPIFSSPDLGTWTQRGYIFPGDSAPAWAGTNFWAPELHLVNGMWTAYFAATNTTSGKLSVGVAKSMSGTPVGPYKGAAVPLVSNSTMGMIDPTAFQDDDGQWYLIWKEDGNAVGLPTPIYLAPLSADGLSLTGAWTQLLVNDPHSWEGILTEAPWMVKHNGEYFLFYSGNIYAAYAIGVARAATVRGPFVKAASNPILHTNTSVSQPPFLGPGHCSVVQVGGAGGSHAILYHTWPYGTNINFGDPRHMMLDTVVWDAATGWPSLATGGSPSSTQQPLP